MFGYEDLIETEIQTYIDTSEKIKAFYEYGAKIVELFFALEQTFGEFDDINTPTGELQSIAYMHFVQLPYTTNVIYEQTMKGYYLESNILLRHLFETLLQLKYFLKFPEKIKAHMEKNIRLATMIKELNYTKALSNFYGYLCKYTHGFITKYIERTDRTANKTYLGVCYKQENFFGVFNVLIELVLGFVNIYGEIFPKNTLEKDNNVKVLKENVYEWCVSNREADIKTNPSSRNWHGAMSDLIF